MHNIDKTRKAIENHPEVLRTDIEQFGPHQRRELVISAFVEDMTDEFNEAIDEMGLRPRKVKWVGFGFDTLLVPDEEFGEDA